ncbi:MAG: chitinase, partial [Acidobacteriota bacterium]|nr:chitinase [Acidobacteriota bacterium]
YLLARTVNAPAPRVYLTMIERTGLVRSDEAIAPTAPESLVRIDVTTGNSVIGIFYEQESTRHIMLAPIEAGELETIRKVWDTTGPDLVIDARATDFVLARTQTQDDGRKTIRWKIVDTAGREVRQEARLLIGTGLDVAPLSLMARGDEIIIAYLDARDGFDNQLGNYRIRRVNTEGDTLSDTFFAATDSGRRRAQTPYDFVWTGDAFAAIVVRDTDAGDDSFLVRLCALKAEISGPRVMHPGDTVTFTGTAEGGVPPYSYVWSWGFFNEAFGPTPQIRFDTAGTYVLTLTITDDTGSIATDTFEVTVAPQVKPRRRSVRK